VKRIIFNIYQIFCYFSMHLNQDVKFVGQKIWYKNYWPKVLALQMHSTCKNYAKLEYCVPVWRERRERLDSRQVVRRCPGVSFFTRVRRRRGMVVGVVVLSSSAPPLYPQRGLAEKPRKEKANAAALPVL